MSYLGVDIGMTGAKALIVGEKGDVLRRSYTNYGGDYKKNLLKEINPRHIWNGIHQIVRACQCKNLKDPVKTISFSVSGDDFFPADNKGKPLANVISAYQDTGIEYEDHIIERAGGERQIFEITGQPICRNVYPLHRILWLKSNMPRVYDKTWKFMCWEEFFNHRLTGECISDYSLASRMLLFDISRKEWSKTLIKKMDLEYNKFPDVYAPGRIVGKVRKKIAEELNLPPHCLVVTGGFDQATASLGAGVTRPSIFSLSLGTVVASHWLIEDRNTTERKDYSYCCSLVGNKYMGFFFSFNGCAVLNWFFREFGRGKKDSGKDIYAYYNGQIKAHKPSKLFMMPHLGGAMQPYNDLNSKGVLLGIRLDTRGADVLKSIYEGIVFDLKRNYKILEEDKIVIKEIRAVGGGSRSDVWMQMLANILGYEISTLKIDEGSSMGAVLLGAWAVGKFSSVEEAVETWIAKKRSFWPERKGLKAFHRKYQKYIGLYPKVKSFNHFLEQCHG